MRRTRAPVQRQGMLPSFDEISDADMARAAGMQRAQENRKKALEKLAARRVVRAPAAYKPAAPRAPPRSAWKQPDKAIMKWADWFDKQWGSKAPEWVVRRLAVWDDKPSRTKLLKRSGRYALAKWWIEQGIDPNKLVDWARDNPSLTDKHVQHFKETVQQLHIDRARGTDEDPFYRNAKGEWQYDYSLEPDFTDNWGRMGPDERDAQYKFRRKLRWDPDEIDYINSLEKRTGDEQIDREKQELLENAMLDRYKKWWPRGIKYGRLGS
jgi:hypothetical protein